MKEKSGRLRYKGRRDILIKQNKKFNIQISKRLKNRNLMCDNLPINNLVMLKMTKYEKIGVACYKKKM